MPLSEAALPLLDEGVQRGDGAYDTVGVWDGRPFRLDDHLERLAASLAAIRLPPVDEAALRAEIAKLLDGVRGDAVLRFHLTASGRRVVTLAPPPVRREPRVLIPQPAPWIQPATRYPPAGAKTMSYGPNMQATRAAQDAGGDDALLVTVEGPHVRGRLGRRRRRPRPRRGARHRRLDQSADAARGGGRRGAGGAARQLAGRGARRGRRGDHLLGGAGRDRGPAGGGLGAAGGHPGARPAVRRPDPPATRLRPPGTCLPRERAATLHGHRWARRPTAPTSRPVIHEERVSRD